MVSVVKCFPCRYLFKTSAAVVLEPVGLYLAYDSSVQFQQDWTLGGWYDWDVVFQLFFYFKTLGLKLTGFSLFLCWLAVVESSCVS